MAETTCAGDTRTGTGAAAAATVFVCANCARPGKSPSSAGRPQPEVPNFAWPMPVRSVVVPCTGRLQPEHVLREFESGADVVCAVACEQDNCHYIEGSRRCARRVDYIRSILEAIGLDGRRLMLFWLPGTAAEDMAVSLGKAAPARWNGTMESQVALIRERVVEALESLPANPLREPPPAWETEESNQEVDASYDDREQ